MACTICINGRYSDVLR